MCLINCLVCVYSENPSDFPTGSFSFTNLVQTNATNYTRIRDMQLPKST